MHVYFPQTDAVSLAILYLYFLPEAIAYYWPYEIAGAVIAWLVVNRAKFFRTIG